MIPRYYALDCIPALDGSYQILDVHGGVGGGLNMLASAYGGKSQARARLRPYVQRLGEIAQGKRILFLHDLFTTGQTFPDDFFNLIQEHIAYCPITDWVPDLQEYRRRHWDTPRVPDIEQMGVFLDPLASQLRLKLAYSSAARVQYQGGRSMLLLSGYRDRARQRGDSIIVRPDEIGVAVFSGPMERFPDDLRGAPWFPVINPPLMDRFFENKWLLPMLMRDTPQESLLPQWIPVGMGMRTCEEVLEFAGPLEAPKGFPLAVLKPSNLGLSLGVRFLDRTALRALASRQPKERLPFQLARDLLAPHVAHSYEEVTAYRGKQLDNLLRTSGAHVHDHGDGTFHYSAPYPFLESTVAILQQYVEARPIKSRRTGLHHRGYIRVVLFDHQVLAAFYRLDQDPEDGTFRDLTRQEVKTFFEGVPPDEEASLGAQLLPFFEEFEREFAARIHSEQDLNSLRDRWVMEQTAG